MSLLEIFRVSQYHNPHGKYVIALKVTCTQSMLQRLCHSVGTTHEYTVRLNLTASGWHCYISEVVDHPQEVIEHDNTTFCSSHQLLA